MKSDHEPGIAHWLTTRTGRSFAARPAEVVHGGSINHCVRWPAAGGDAFVKLRRGSRAPAYAAEAEGLANLLARTRCACLRFWPSGRSRATPYSHSSGSNCPVGGEGDARFQARLGEGLAMQHRVTAARCGWHRDNTIGATPQHNAWDDDWVRFFQQRRLGVQLDLAARNGLEPAIVERGRELCERCGAFFSSYHPRPSLLHGDLWGGNAGRMRRRASPSCSIPRSITATARPTSR